MLTVPGKTDVAFSIYDNQAAGAAGFGAEEGGGYLGCFAGRLSTRYKIGGAFGYEQAGEIFTKYHPRMRLLSGTGRNAAFLYWGSGGWVSFINGRPLTTAVKYSTNVL